MIHVQFLSSCMGDWAPLQSFRHQWAGKLVLILISGIPLLHPRGFADAAPSRGLVSHFDG